MLKEKSSDAMNQMKERRKQTKILKRERACETTEPRANACAKSHTPRAQHAQWQKHLGKNLAATLEEFVEEGQAGCHRPLEAQLQLPRQSRRIAEAGQTF